MSATEATSVLLLKGISSYMQKTLINLSGPYEMKKNNYKLYKVVSSPLQNSLVIIDLCLEFRDLVRTSE